MDENDWYHINYKHVKKTNFASFKNNIRYGSNVHHMSPQKSDYFICTIHVEIQSFILPLSALNC